MELSSTFLVVTGLGLVTVVVACVGLSGRLLRSPSSRLPSNYTAQLLFGIALACMGVGAGLGDRASWLSVPALVALGMGVYAHLVRPQRFLQPDWQRELDDEYRRSRR